MCLIIFAHQANEQYPLILSANRDEFFYRKSREAQFWREEVGCSNLLAGKDLQAGGTWIGVTLDGKFAAITNLRSNSKDDQALLSRGSLTLEYLIGKDSPQNFAEAITEDLSEYRGFNLLLGRRDEVIFMNSRDKSISIIEPGVYAFSNETLNSNYLKVIQGRNKLSKLLDSGKEVTPDFLIKMMCDRTVAADNLLPNTGIPKSLERKLSAAFVSDPDRNYGTVCSTAFVATSAGRAKFLEQNYGKDGSPTSSHYFEYSMQQTTV